LLVSIAATLVLHFTNDGRPVLDAEERAPQGFRTGSEQGLETSTRPMGESSGSSQNTEKKATDTDVLAEQRIVSPTAPSAIERDPAPAPAVRQPSLATIDREPPLQRNPERVIGELEPLPLIKEKLTIHFKLNSNEIDDESYDTLDRIALFLKQNPGQRVSVRGYTDSTGAVSYNQSISQFRANAVKSYLVGKGARPERLQVYAMGPEDPIASNETVEGRRLNRRVEIDFLN
jgi:general secretion pathway protein A